MTYLFPIFFVRVLRVVFFIAFNGPTVSLFFVLECFTRLRSWSCRNLVQGAAIPFVTATESMSMALTVQHIRLFHHNLEATELIDELTLEFYNALLSPHNACGSADIEHESINNLVPPFSVPSSERIVPSRNFPSIFVATPEERDTGYSFSRGFRELYR